MKLCLCVYAYVFGLVLENVFLTEENEVGNLLKNQKIITNDSLYDQRNII